MNKFDELYIDIAERVSRLSYAKRLKVGAVIAKENNILGYGYNGTPAGCDNDCEYPIVDHGEELVTKQSVLHAESNAIMKVARSTQTTEGSSLYVTVSPCMECAKLIIQSGITKVFYLEKYRDTSAITFLTSNNIEVTRIEK